MDVVRRNTDYAARLMVHLAKHYGNGPISTRAAAAEEEVPYQLACKLMQKLNNAKLVTSCMGPKGGFVLGTEPSKISLLEVVEAIQGPISINRCVLSEDACSRQTICAVREKLVDIQENMTRGLAAITLNELARRGRSNGNASKRKRRKQ
ncbi:MAG: Rrf2 family transcriptional regulator [Sedimentisphaerales bacterium]